MDGAGNPEPASAVIVQGTDSLLVAAARALVVSTLFRPGRVRGRVVQTLVELPVEFSAASVPPVTLHMAGDVYREAEVQERPHRTSGPPLAYPAPLLLSRSEEHTSELQSPCNLVCRLLLEKKKQLKAGDT